MLPPTHAQRQVNRLCVAFVLALIVLVIAGVAAHFIHTPQWLS